jgi:diguanylate cyclase
VNLETGVVTGAEALLRLQRMDRRQITPTQFVGVAEECGLILSIGRWVLREACRQAQAWQSDGHILGRIAVNVSARELQDKEFLAGVRSILGDTGLDPSRLELELTESAFMDTERMTSTMRALKGLGVQIAVDDFGTGQSSLSHLQRFPIDTIKIDQSFVQDIDNHAGKAIVGAVIAMGMSLKQRVVAEGIETPGQSAFLREHRCAEGQGFLLGRPVAAAQFPWCGDGPGLHPM